MKEDKLRSFRFWHDFNGSYVRITIRAGEEVNLESMRRTDEGFIRRWVSFRCEDDGSAIHVDEFVRQRDCDGVSESGWAGVCSTDKLAARVGCPEFEESRGLMLPEWEEEGKTQRDFSAEAAGY